MSTPNLTALVGPPGAGKTTLRTTYPNALVVSLDDNRRALSWCGCGNNQDGLLRAVAVQLAQTTARSALTAGRDVLWDATNAHPADRAALLLLAAETGASATARLVLPPLEVVLHRNAQRSPMSCVCGHARRVPEDVVRAMHAAITHDLPALPHQGWTRVENPAHHQRVTA
ncbi:ATP-binding protein [Actinosynnema pretiosum subsp. pretiosum]|uniref:ATP-binding protein n=1 Tax=Actinosynnema pretiosum subsp. pretiosum TaxID=103721 RepID=A0AA45R651_9PSEU|nr:putative ATP/GTP-binding protein [Actinosynnema pretiosum subsp. pretiosum]QUF06360.1 ATP-binding protein [Actinosynnema pretiosum subsp. pretiosum]